MKKAQQRKIGRLKCRAVGEGCELNMEKMHEMKKQSRQEEKKI